jgi:hypothetical protein
MRFIGACISCRRNVLTFIGGNDFGFGVQGDYVNRESGERLANSELNKLLAWVMLLKKSLYHRREIY